MSFSTHTLDNGLQLVFEEIPRIRSAAVGFLANTGSRDEPVRLSGVSHFLEHMCFKGTAKRDWRQLSLDVDDLGAMWNAYTWWEGTAYFHWVQSERVHESIDILSDMMRSTLPNEEFDMEKKVILEEIAMYNDRPDAMIFDDLIQSAYDGHPLGQSILGTEESVGGIARDEMAEYFDRRYAPNNLTFIITGQFDRDQIIETVTNCCGDWTSHPADREQAVPTFSPSAQVQTREGVAREHIAFAVPAPAARHDESVTADLLAAYLGASTNSRLFWSVIQKGLADEASADYYGFSDSGLFYVYISVDPANAAEVMEIIRGELKDLSNGIDADALERTKTKAATSLVCSGQHGLHRFSQIVGDLSTDTPLISLDEHLAEIDGVTPDRIGKYLEQYPVDTDPALIALGPMDKATW
jgi:predicted Zn-dependent peptidase